MNDREKLIELLDQARVAQFVYTGIDKPLQWREVRAVDEIYVQQLADLLIANGVTVQRKGNWEISLIEGERFVCSSCGGACWYYDYQGIISRSAFCPNCGAKMDLENANEKE